MLDWLWATQCIAAGAVALLMLVLGVFKRPPSAFSTTVFATLAVLGLAQLVASTVLLAQGLTPVSGAIEFVIYLVVALLVTLLAGFWAMIEKTRFSTFVLAIAAATYLVMLFREQQLWYGVV